MKRTYAYPALVLALTTFAITLSVVTPNIKPADTLPHVINTDNNMNHTDSYEIDKSAVVQNAWVSVGGSEYVTAPQKTSDGFLVLDRITK